MVVRRSCTQRPALWQINVGTSEIREDLVEAPASLHKSLHYIPTAPRRGCHQGNIRSREASWRWRFSQKPGRIRSEDLPHKRAVSADRRSLESDDRGCVGSLIETISARERWAAGVWAPAPAWPARISWIRRHETLLGLVVVRIELFHQVKRC